jgi:hypothetical protein
LRLILKSNCEKEFGTKNFKLNIGKTKKKKKTWIKLSLFTIDMEIKMFYKKISRRRAITPAEIPPVTGTVTIHATIIFRNNDQSTLCFERKRPIATTLPTLQ